jgi:hypothetical protein
VTRLTGSVPAAENGSPRAGGLAVLGTFCLIETRVAEPMFRLALFRIRPFTAGNLASLLAGLGRGGLMFILIIWLQGIRHGGLPGRGPGLAAARPQVRA